MMKLHLITTGEYSGFTIVDILRVPDGFSAQQSLESFVWFILPGLEDGLQHASDYEFDLELEPLQQIMKQISEEPPADFWEAFVCYLVAKCGCERVDFSREQVKINKRT